MKKKLSVLLTMVVVAISLTGCKGFDTPELVTISPSTTAFMIPLVGDTTKQASFQSEKLLALTKVPTKQVRIPHIWLKTGRTTIFGQTGKYIPGATLILVERKPVTREWTSGKEGTSIKNQGIVAESKESIGFMSQMNCSAQIDETDAVKFLYRYNSKPLEDVMDTEIRAKIESTFVEECGKLTMADILNSKEKIMDTIRNEITPYFAAKGITITVIGMKGEFTYLDPSIQTAINQKFIAQKTLEAQDATNKTVISKAEADAKAVKAQESTMAAQIQLKKLDNDTAWIKKWDGKQSTVTGSNSTIYGMSK